MEDTAATVDKAIDLLFALHAQGGPAGVSELARALGLPKTTAHRLLGTLARRGLLEREAGGGYRPGMRLAALGLGALEAEPVIAAARPVLEAELAGGRETLFLAGARGGRLLVLDKAEGSAFLRASPRIGEEVPAPPTAVGKLHLAFAPQQLPRVRIDARLERELGRVRRAALAQNRDDWTPGLSAVAAPVFLGERLLAAVAVAGPSAELDVRVGSPAAARVRSAAAHIEARLAGRAEGRAA
jgi:DNA-binding IclR family transcriptional regulator